MISLTSPVETRAHRWPAGLKLGALCLSTVLLFVIKAPLFQLCVGALTLGLYLLPGRLFAKAGARALWRLWPFVLLLMVWHVISGDLGQGLLISTRMITAVGLANLVTMTTRLSDMIALIRWLATPLRWIGLKTVYLEIAIALAIRFTPVLLDKSQKLSQSWRARSARRPGWRIVLPFAVLALDDADHVAEALRARGGFDAMKE